MAKSHSLTIRIANSADAEEIARLHTISWQSAYKNMLSEEFLAGQILANRMSVWRKKFSSENEKGYNTLLAYNDVVLVGFICMLLDADDKWGTLIDNLHVHPDHKGIGIGKALMRSAADWLTSKRPNSPVHMLVYEENTEAHAFYKHLGGQIIGRELELRSDGQSKYSLKYIWPNPASLIDAVK